MFETFHRWCNHCKQNTHQSIGADFSGKYLRNYYQCGKCGFDADGNITDEPKAPPSPPRRP
jgi:hypothetical protein